jgi:hypothetical protein
MASTPALAQDQPWLSDRRFTEGPGLRVGDFELHPGLAAEFGYDSNFLRRADNENALGSLRLRVTPSFAVSSLGPQRSQGAQLPDVTFRGGIAATYNEFIPVMGNDSDQKLIQDQRNVGGVATLDFRFFPGRTFFGELHLGAQRTIQASNQGLDLSFNRITGNGIAEVGWAPRGGLFEWRLGYRFDGTFFEANRAQQLTNLGNTITTRGRWRFLPRTAFAWDGSLSFIDYTSPVSKTSSRPLRARIGFNGLVTNWLNVLVMGGWGTSLYQAANPADPPADFDSFIGQAELKFYLTPNPQADPKKASLSVSALSLGFARDFYDSFIGSYTERNRGYLNLAYFYGGRFAVSLDGGVSALTYPVQSVDPVRRAGYAQPDGWTDIGIDATLFAEYRFKDWLGANLTGRYSTNISSQVLRDPDSGDDDSLQWQNIEAYLGLRLMF